MRRLFKRLPSLICKFYSSNNLFVQIIQDVNFPDQPIKAIVEGFKQAEKLFLEYAEA